MANCASLAVSAQELFRAIRMDPRSRGERWRLQIEGEVRAVYSFVRQVEVRWGLFFVAYWNKWDLILVIQ